MAIDTLIKAHALTVKHGFSCSNVMENWQEPKLDFFSPVCVHLSLINVESLAH